MKLWQLETNVNWYLTILQKLNYLTYLTFDTSLCTLACVRVTVNLTLAATHLTGHPDILTLFFLQTLDVADAGLTQQSSPLTYWQGLPATR